MRFEDMDVWKRSTQLSISIYRELSEIRDYGFKDQVTRSSLSVPGNIADGFGRATDKDKRNFLNYAKGSCAEFRSQIYIGGKIGYIPVDKVPDWIRETEKISAMLTGLMRYLEN